MFIDSVTFVEKSVWGFADTMGIKGYELDPSMLSTFDTVTDAKAPILHKIFPGLRAMLQYVILQVEPPHPFCQTGSGISRPPTLSRLKTATQKTPLTLKSPACQSPSTAAAPPSANPESSPSSPPSAPRPPSPSAPPASAGAEDTSPCSAKTPRNPPPRAKRCWTVDSPHTPADWCCRRTLNPSSCHCASVTGRWISSSRRRGTR